MVSPAFEHLLFYGNTRRLTPEELARAIHIDPSQTKADFEGPDREQHEAVNGHVYLEKVEDTNGNRFFVLFKVLAVDEQSRYMAFVWRCLPGGKIVRRN